MTTNVKVFKSTDAGAPSLSGTAATLISLLQACLVDGYNSKSATITRSGSTATVTATSHGFLTDQCILIAGANEAEYNGEHYITVTGTDTFTFAVTGTPSTPATGTITAKNAPAGWTKPYTGTNKAAFRAGGGNQMYLRVDDSQSQYGRVFGYQAMTDVDTGTDQFPTAVQVSGGLYWSKSSTADAVARTWVLVANDRLLHLFVSGSTSTSGTNCGTYAFGDIKSYKSGDQFATLLVGTNSATPFNNTYASTNTALNAATAGHYLTRSYTTIGGSVAVGKHGDSAKIANGANFGATASSSMAYPNPVDGGLYISPLWVHEPIALAVRGEIPGLWGSLHYQPLAMLDTFTGASGSLSGKKFLAIRDGYSSYQGAMFLEISNTWSI